MLWQNKIQLFLWKEMPSRRKRKGKQDLWAFKVQFNSAWDSHLQYIEAGSNLSIGRIDRQSDHWDPDGLSNAPYLTLLS